MKSRSEYLEAYARVRRKVLSIAKALICVPFETSILLKVIQGPVQKEEA